MSEPDFKIECIRCTASENLNAPAAKRDGDSWKPINAQRPEGWIAGPVALVDVSRGICPRCAAEWEKLQEAFVTTPPEDPNVEMRNPITFSAKKTSVVPVRVETQHSTHIPLRDEEAPRATSIPLVASQPEAPQVTQAAAPPPAVKSVPLHNRGVTMQPNARIIREVPATRMSGIAQPAQNVRVSPIQTHGQAVKVTATAGVAQMVAPTTVQRILHTPAPTVLATPIGEGATPLASYPADKVEPVQSSRVVRYSAPKPIESK